MFISNEKRWQRLFAQQIVRQDYDWWRENSEQESLWNTAMLIELEELVFFTSSWKTTGLNCRDRKILMFLYITSTIQRFHWENLPFWVKLQKMQNHVYINEDLHHEFPSTHRIKHEPFFFVMRKIIKHYSIIYPKTQSSKLFALNKNYMKYHWYTVNGLICSCHFEKNSP